MAIDTDIKRLSKSLKTAMAMPEQMPGIIVALVPDSEAIMTKDDRFSLDRDIHQVSYLEKAVPVVFLPPLIVSSAN